MNDINTVTLTGRLVRDAEFKYTTSGLAITKFSIAVNYSVKRNEQWQEEADFFDITLFGKLGEAIIKYLAKGVKITIAGRLKQNTWQNNEGQKRSKVEVIANDVILHGNNKHPAKQQQDEQFENQVDDGDIPF